MSTIRLFSLLLFWSLASFSLLAQSKIESAINKLLNDRAFRHAGITISVIDVESNKLIASHDPHLSLSPASSLKTLTTATALKLLGSDYTYKTSLQYDGTISSSGILSGNIYLKGSGDPTLGSDRYDKTADIDELMQKFVEAIRKKGIRRIKGHIIGDASCFETAASPRGWTWEDMGNYYGAGAWGLNLHGNLYYLYFRQNNSFGKTPAIARIEPLIPELVFFNEVTTAARGSGDNAYIFGAPYSYERYVRGTIPAGTGTFSIKGSIPDSPGFAAAYLKKKLQNSGITVEKPAANLQELKRTGLENKKRSTFYTHHSPPIKEIIRQTNFKSVNLYAESLLKTLGKVKKDEGSLSAGIEVIENYWKDRGLDISACFVKDGSGLSPQNAVSSYFLAGMLRKMAKDKSFPHFLNALPQSGKTGPLKNKFNGTVAEGRIWAKSGSIEGARAYAGYAKTKSGKMLAFSVMINNYNGSGNESIKKLRRFMLALCE